MTHTLHLGDCRDVLATMGDATVDAIVCDPPYELGFMGKAWDASGIAYDVTVWQQCLRVLKPGGHLIAFGGSRTYHRLAVAIEDAGFEIRDQIQWIYGSGFPKSLDVSKAMDKQAGAAPQSPNAGKWKPSSSGAAPTHGTGWGTEPTVPHNWAPVTDLAKQWHGWGTALKPAHEPAVLARKPLRGAVADTVAQWGTGALNIEGTRVGSEVMPEQKAGQARIGTFVRHNMITPEHAGRWPTNVILDEEAALVLDGHSGRSVSSKPNSNIAYGSGVTAQNHVYGLGLAKSIPNTPPYGDSGGASRFFYVAKASKAEREAGLDGVALTPIKGRDEKEDEQNVAYKLRNQPRANHHPTVKPLALMRYLVRMVTPLGGVVLDPFMGSGSTGCAAVREGFDFVGIDLTPEYVAIAQKRIDWHAVTSPLDNVATMELHKENDA